MPRPRVYSTPAIVLRQRKLGDADKILTLYAANLGKIDAVAKGVRRTKSRMAGHVEPLTHATFQLAQGKSLDIVTQVDTLDPFQPLREDLDRLSHAIYAAELLDKFTEPREASFELYRLLLDTLRRLSAGGDIDTTLRYYEMALLSALGYRPELEACVTCRKPLAPVTNYWSAPAGGVICPDCGHDQLTSRAISVNALKLLRLIAHASYADVLRVSVDGALGADLERAMLEYVRCVLERDVRSARFMDTLRRSRPRVRAAAEDAG